MSCTQKCASRLTGLRTWLGIETPKMCRNLVQTKNSSNLESLRKLKLTRRWKLLLKLKIKELQNPKTAKIRRAIAFCNTPACLVTLRLKLRICSGFLDNNVHFCINHRIGPSCQLRKSFFVCKTASKYAGPRQRVSPD